MSSQGSLFWALTRGRSSVRKPTGPAKRLSLAHSLNDLEVRFSSLCHAKTPASYCKIIVLYLLQCWCMKTEIQVCLIVLLSVHRKVSQFVLCSNPVLKISLNTQSSLCSAPLFSSTIVIFLFSIDKDNHETIINT